MVANVWSGSMVGESMCRSSDNIAASIWIETLSESAILAAVRFPVSIKGQIIFEMTFGIFGFFQKTNERIRFFFA